MLKINYRYRKSANDCLRKVYRLKFHEISIVDTERITFIKKTIDQDDVTRIKSVITQPFQNVGFCDIKDASKMIKIAPSKRDLRNEIHFYNRAFQRSLQHISEITQI